MIQIHEPKPIPESVPCPFCLNQPPLPAGQVRLCCKDGRVAGSYLVWMIEMYRDELKNKRTKLDHEKLRKDIAALEEYLSRDHDGAPNS